jgi:glycosyltransferase involved in cell wall biosynthesis
MNELITIVLGIYNQEKFIEKSIDSIFDQTYKNFELIIINNGSTDNSILVINKYLKRKNVTLLNYDKNNFIGKVLNDATSIARGKYICFTAGDDYYYPEYLEKNLSAMLSLPDDYGVVYSPTYVHNLVTDNFYIESKVFNKSGYVFEELIDAQITGFIPAFTPFIKREVFDKVPHDETIFCEGEMIYIRIAKYFKFQYINKPLQVSTEHLNNQGKNYKENAQSFYEQMGRLILLYPEQEKKIKKIIGKMFLRNSWIAIRVMGDKKWMKYCILLALKSNILLVFHWKFYLLILFAPFSVSLIDNILFFRRKDNGRNDTHIDVNYKNITQ